MRSPAVGHLDDVDLIVSGGGNGELHLLDPPGEKETVILSGHTGRVGPWPSAPCWSGK
jgi:hypothetical protein